MLIDSHTHLQDKKFARDLDRVLERSADAGIERLVCVGDRIETSRKAIAMARRNPRLTASAGIHPHHESLFAPVSMLELEVLARDPSVVAIGEIGLDFHYPKFDAKRQIHCFVSQAHVATRHNLPLIVHCRDAYDALLDAIKTDEQVPRRGVIHCFSGTYEDACRFIDLGYYLGIGGAITYPNGDQLRDMVRRIGLNHIVSETDAPYLPPQIKRGRRNEPSYMKHTIKALADLCRLTYQDAARITKHNAIRLFRLPEVFKSSTAYSIRQTLYLEVTNRCPNECYYCERCSDYMIMGHFLRLEEEPLAQELLAQINNPAQYREIVLSGLGEPTVRWDVCKEVASALKLRGARVRLNTNGQGCLINGRDIVGEMAGLFDSVAVTLVAHDKQTYNEIAKPSDPARAWDAMIEFVKKCKDAVPDVILTVVAVPEVDVEACRRLAEDELQVRFRIREYRPQREAAGRQCVTVV